MNPARWHAQAKRRLEGAAAFSLLELVLVVCLLAIIGAIAAPRYANSLTTYRADMASKRVAADLMLARNNAWCAGAARTVTFSTTTHSYTMAGIRALDSAAADYVVQLAIDPYAATIVSAAFNGQPSVTFSGYGLPNAGGQVVVGAGASRKTIVLDANSGNASVP